MTVSKVNTYLRPSSMEEAWSLLQAGGKKARLVGGGVDAGLSASPEVTTLIDLDRVSNRSIRMAGEGDLSVGAGATLTSILESKEAHRFLDGILDTVLRQVASPLLRNVATLGGALACAKPWSDVITLCLALDAQVTRYAGHREVRSLQQLLDDRGTIDRAIITDVVLPAPSAGTFAGFEKFTRTGFDIGMLNCACRLVMEDRTCQDARIVLGGTPDIGQRVGAAEAALMGRALNLDAIDRAAEQAAAAIPARDDVRASAKYRRTLAAAGVRHCLTTIARRLGE